MPIDIRPGAQFTLPLLDLGHGASIGDAYATDDPEKPITAGVFAVTKADTPLLYKYGYHETKIILEGELWLEILDEEESKGKIIKAVPGDIIRIAKGTHVSFSSPSHGKAFYVGQRGYQQW